MERTMHSYTWKDHLFNISLVFFFILPQNGLLYYFVPVAMFLMTDWRKPRREQLRALSGGMVASLAITFMLNSMSPWVTTKSFLKLIELTLLILCFGRLRRITIIKEYLVFLVIYLIVFQFAYQFNVPLLGQLMQQIYPLSADELEQYAFRQDLGFSDIGGASARLGGIYYNSNNCASFLEMLLLLVVNERKQFKKGMFLILVALIVIGVLSTGSRTSMLILAVLMMFMFARGKASEKWGALAFMVAAIVYYLLYGSGMRMFMVKEGMDDSFMIKVGILADYILSQDSLIRLFFGCQSGSYLVYVLGNPFPGTDFDIGDVIVAYGFVFAIILFFFLWFLYKKLGRYNTFLCILIWCFSNTIFMSYRASALFLLITSMYYSRNLSGQKNIQ